MKWPRHRALRANSISKYEQIRGSGGGHISDRSDGNTTSQSQASIGKLAVSRELTDESASTMALSRQMVVAGDPLLGKTS